MLANSFLILSLAATALSAPLSLLRRANPCFVTGSVALPAEVADGLPALEQAVTCNAKVQVASGVPDVISGGIAYSSIDFQKSSLSRPRTRPPLISPTLQNQLNDYLALEAGVRSQPNSSVLLAKLKGPKFFLQFQIARALGVADTVSHQLGKVTKNAVGASAAELAQVTALSKQL
ncbi:hypothetical protein C8F01DRAFT_1109441 [Mycena amicta]|nr:hypothetical protein C8F01DRAFT_1109441 [Mycena amicta]